MNWAGHAGTGGADNLTPLTREEKHRQLTSTLKLALSIFRPAIIEACGRAQAHDVFYYDLKRALMIKVENE